MALTSTLSRFFGLGIAKAEGLAWEWEDRRLDYALWQAMHDNRAYDLQVDGGFREAVLKDTLGIDCSAGSSNTPKLIGHFNPVKQIVSAYQQMLPGQYGVEIGIADKVDGRPVNPVLLDPLRDPLGRLWRKSNLDTSKQVLQRWGANLGSVGIRVIADAESNSVYLQIDEPARIKDYQADSRGNITRVLLQYTRTIGFGEDAVDVEVVEDLSEESFSVTHDGEQQLEDSARENVMGFCPYVIYRHTDDGSGGFGRPCHDGTLNIIHAINWTLTNQSESIYEHMWPQWFLTAAGNAPEEIAFGKAKVWYVKTDPDGVNPSAEAIVPQLNQSDVTVFLEARKREVRDRQPETALGSLDTLSGLSGESYAKLLLSAEQRILDARANLQHALKRAISMAFSYQSLFGLTDFGTGTGSREAADRAFENGAMDFEFKPMPGLPTTVADRIQQVNLDTTRRSNDIADANAAKSLVDRTEQLRIAGYNETQIALMLDREATEGVIPTEPL